MLYALRGALWDAVRRFAEWEYRDTAGRKNRSTGLKMAFAAVLLFGAVAGLLDMGAKNAARKPLEGLQAAGNCRVV